MALMNQKISDTHSSCSFKEKNRTPARIFYLCFQQWHCAEFLDCISNISGFHKTEDTADCFCYFNHIINFMLLIAKKEKKKRQTVDIYLLSETPYHKLHVSDYAENRICSCKIQTHHASAWLRRIH